MQVHGRSRHQLARLRGVEDASEDQQPGGGHRDDGQRPAGVAAGLKDSGRPDVALVVNDGPRHDAAVVKLYTGEAYKTVSDLGLQILGGYGYCMEYPMQRFFRTLQVADADTNLPERRQRDSQPTTRKREYRALGQQESNQSSTTNAECEAYGNLSPTSRGPRGRCWARRSQIGARRAG